jgi:hypothetical protein
MWRVGGTQRREGWRTGPRIRHLLSFKIGREEEIIDKEGEIRTMPKWKKRRKARIVGMVMHCMLADGENEGLLLVCGA